MFLNAQGWLISFEWSLRLRVHTQINCLSKLKGRDQLSYAGKNLVPWQSQSFQNCWLIFLIRTSFFFSPFQVPPVPFIWGCSVFASFLNKRGWLAIKYNIWKADCSTACPKSQNHTISQVGRDQQRSFICSQFILVRWKEAIKMYVDQKWSKASNAWHSGRTEDFILHFE